ncbi:paternally-expressed gene 3 protein [Plakobranchus ocellatus]|uniref:Paternally-expressed gene 3 protein n=1 Tax=Plakobranchus ocellatus TaxID=259542 RepID=A0AAV4DFI0_9GAST|nr:paternally-expressed gene 3 protein [Plakobranchus ocellatus]
MSIHNFLLQAQYSFASRRSHGPIVACSFPNSEKVKKFKSARTKTSSISRFMTNENTNSLIREFRKLPLSNNSDDNHTVDAKPYPVVIIFPDADSQTISSQALSIPILKETSTGGNRADLSIQEFEKLGILLVSPASAPQPGLTSLFTQPVLTSLTQQPTLTSLTQQPVPTSLCLKLGLTSFSQQPAPTSPCPEPGLVSLSQQPAPTRHCSQRGLTSLCPQPCLTSLFTQPGLTSLTQQPTPTSLCPKPCLTSLSQ